MSKGENMKKYRVIILILVCLIVLYITYVTIDCIRIRNSKTGTKPFITISEKNTENKITYNGLGYLVTYYKDTNITIKENIILAEQLGYGAEFRLFSKILIWAWVE